MKGYMRIAVSLLLLTALGMTLCSACDWHEKSDDPRPKIIATTTILGDLARNICGDKFQVSCLMGAGIDPHMYRASARDCIRLEEADIILCNGINLEGKMEKVLKKTESAGKTVLSVEDALDSEALIAVTSDGSIFDPHVWFDVKLWIRAAEYVSEGICSFDPDNADYYRVHTTEYLEKLYKLDDYIKSRADEIPKEKRVLITAHDAFSYFGRAYDFKIYGIQGISTNAEAGTQDISRLANFIAEHEIGAVFLETSVSSKTVDALISAVKARGATVKKGALLYSDALGDANSGADTYIKALRSNVDAIVNALKN